MVSLAALVLGWYLGSKLVILGVVRCGERKTVDWRILEHCTCCCHWVEQRSGVRIGTDRDGNTNRNSNNQRQGSHTVLGSEAEDGLVHVVDGVDIRGGENASDQGANQD